MFSFLFSSSEEKKLAKGDKGDKGDRGEKGEKGDMGDRGELGPRGLRGEQGDVGPQGLKGNVGIGAAGPPGDTGPRGLAGPTGMPGPKGDIGPQGIQGEMGVVKDDYDEFTQIKDFNFGDGWTKIDKGDPAWDPIFRGPGRVGLAYTSVQNENLNKATATISVLPKVKTGYLIHLPWPNCRYFNIFGVLSGGRGEVFIKRVNSYQPNGYEKAGHHSGVEAIPIQRVDRFESIKVAGVKGEIHLMGMGWTTTGVSGDSNGFVHADNIVGDLRTNILKGPGNENNQGGRLHLASEDRIYLLPKQGVHITKDWGASGNLDIGGSLNINNGGKPVTHFNFNDTNVNYIRGDTVFDSGKTRVKELCDVDGNNCIKVSELALPKEDYKEFTQIKDFTFSKGWVTENGSSRWDPLFRGPSRVGLAYTSVQDENPNDRTATIKVPLAVKTGYLIHLRWPNCRYFNIFGVLSGGRGEVFIKRVNSYQPDGVVKDNHHSGVEAVSIQRVDRFESIKVAGVKGEIHLMGIGWANTMVEGDTNGFVHADNIVGEIKQNPDLKVNSIGRFDGGDFFRIHGTKSNGTALIGGANIGDGRGLVVGDWVNNTAQGEIRATSSIKSKGFQVSGADYLGGAFNDHGLNIRNNNGTWSHFNEEGKSTNSIRGNTEITNDLTVAGKLTTNNILLGGRTHLAESDDWVRLLGDPANRNSYNKGLAVSQLLSVGNTSVGGRLQIGPNWFIEQHGDNLHFHRGDVGNWQLALTHDGNTVARNGLRIEKWNKWL
jgi:hypothetical protein